MFDAGQMARVAWLSSGSPPDIEFFLSRMTSSDVGHVNVSGSLPGCSADESTGAQENQLYCLTFISPEGKVQACP